MRMLLLLPAAVFSAHSTHAAAAAPSPNIVLVMVDDMGWSDLGCYGSEINTPRLDELAAGGLRFSTFYNTGRCCPTRAALLTGVYPHQAGVGRMTFDAGQPGYRGQLGENVVTLAEVLKDAGYRTAMVGKWHLSLTQEREKHLRHLNNQSIRETFADPTTYPVGRGFEKHYGVIWGVVNHFDPFSLVEGAEAVASVPEDYYATDAFTDYAVRYIEEFSQDDERPFFLYVAYTAPHWPLHARPEDIARYEHTYDAGWEAVRRARYERQVKLGLMDPDTAPLSEPFSTSPPLSKGGPGGVAAKNTSSPTTTPPNPPLVRGGTNDWDENQTRSWDSRAMAVHAAMIDRVDQGIGRIVEQLKKSGRFEDTLFLFLSDNGASREEPSAPGFDRVSETRDGRQVVYFGRGADKSILPGPETTYAGIGPRWANVSNTPYRYFKAAQHEGGIRTPLIVHWPQGLKTKPGAIVRAPGHVIDIMATCIDLAAEYPKTRNGREIVPLEGRSLVPVFRGEDRPRHEALFFEHFGAKAVRRGDWKLVALPGGDWELYDLARDETETTDLAAKRPELVRELAAQWNDWALRTNVFPAPGQRAAQRPPRRTGNNRVAAAAAAQRPNETPEGTLRTRWADEVSPDNVHPEYPRPQLVRKRWQNLNGHWSYAIRPKDAPQPDDWDGEILVPFPVESQLSGVRKRIGAENRLWYRRTFESPPLDDGRRLLLHFGAVDWHATVWVNGKRIGEHKGGYDPFSFDVTDALRPDAENELVVSVWDPTDAGSQSRGKQTAEPRGIWYTPVTGIWQTVWLEPVPKAYVKSIQVVTKTDTALFDGLRRGGKVAIKVHCVGTADEDVVDVKVIDSSSGKSTLIDFDQAKPGETIELEISDPRLWSPESPFLYDLWITLFEKKGGGDEVTSYCGLREIELQKDEYGYQHFFLNNKPLFQLGPLDQGWWPDGLYTAPTDEALRYDIEITRQLGFNMLRKHVKVEPARFYYHCDKLGMLVWQDMPNGNPRDKLQLPPEAERDADRDADSARQFEAELGAMIDSLYNHPSIVMWVPFNEGWGQYDTRRIADLVKERDPTRLVNATSGWADRGVGDVEDAHMYPGPGMEPAEESRAAVLGEFGGLGLPVADHLWWNKRNWGYRTYETREELQQHYADLFEALYGLRAFGLAAAVYTQTTDVEGEVNGLMTYDRSVLKFDPEVLRSLHQKLYEPPPVATILAANSELQPHDWRYTFDAPADGWMDTEFDDSAWRTGKAPFATAATPFFPLGTRWPDDRREIRIRRTFDVPEAVLRQLRTHGDLRLKVYHDVADADVYLNGKRIAVLTRDTHRHYGHVDVSEHAGLLHAGPNVIAIHAQKNDRFCAIDAGVYSVAHPVRAKQ
ncbi:MAG: sulfatase-like hydrolase/transferase [Planctomycetes bacterium]|nr:sulfatase-like hydrolase/transferase [Planctomycetota bacterium]